MIRSNVSRILFLALTLCAPVIFSPAAVLAQTRTWSNANAGNFLTGSNWSGDVAPNGVGQSAVIGSNPTGGGTFTLNGAQTLGTLEYSNPAVRPLTGTGMLTFQVSSGNALFRSSGNGYLDLYVPVTLASTTEFRNDGFQNVYVDSPISGSGGLIKTGAGELHLVNSNNSYTGLNTVTAGTLFGDTIANSGTNSSFGRGNFALSNGGELNYEGASASTNRTVALGAGGGAINVSAAGTVLTLTGVISGSNDLDKWGPGTLQLNASNTYTGDTIVESGTLRLGASERIANTSGLSIYFGATFNLNNFNETIDSFSSTGTIALGSGTLTVGGSSYSAASGTISGSGGITNSGSGSLDLQNNGNSYTGLNTISGGTLRGGSIANNGVNSTFGRGNFAISNDATLEYTGATASTNRTISLGTGGGDINVANSATTLSISGVLSGVGGLVKSGEGKLTLSGTNAYTGATTITGGTLSGNTITNSGVNSAFGRGNLAISNGATLEYTGATASTNRTVTLGSGVSNIGVSDAATTLSISGVVGGAGGLNKLGPGKLALSGTNTYAGNNSILAGALSGDTIADSGANSSYGQGNFAISNGATLEYTGATASTNRSVSLGAGGGAINVFNTATTLSIGGALSGTGGLSKMGAGTLQLDAPNSYAGVNSITGGTLRGNTIADSGANSAFGKGNFAISNGAKLEYTGATASTNRIVTLGSTFGAIGVSNAATTLSLSGVSSGAGALSKFGPGRLALLGMNTYAGANSIGDGTLSGNTIADSGVSSAFGQGNFLIYPGATLEYTGATASTNRTVGLLVGGVEDIRITNAATTLSISGVVSNVLGTAELKKSGPGKLALSGMNTYVGVNSITDGTLSGNTIGNNNTNSAFGGSNFAISNGATLEYTGATASTNRTVSLGTGGGAISVANAATTLSIGGALGGSGGLVKDGTGTLELSGANSYSGITRVQGGTLLVAAGGSLAGNGSDKVLVERDADGDFSNGAPNISRSVASGQSYAGLGSQSTGAGALATMADIRGGTNTDGIAAAIAMAWRARTADEIAVEEGGFGSAPPLPAGVPGLASDVLRLTGLAANGLFALEMSYDELKLFPAGHEAQQAADLHIYLAWLNPNGFAPGVAQWQNSVIGNLASGANAVAGYQGAWNTFVAEFGTSDGNLGLYAGSWGVDIDTNKVWTITDHQGEFVVVPEPSSVVLACISACGLLGAAWGRSRRRRHGAASITTTH